MHENTCDPENTFRKPARNVQRFWHFWECDESGPGMNAKINYKAHLQKRLVVFCRFCLQIYLQNGLIWLLKYFIKKSRCVPKNTEIWRGFEVRWNFCCKIILLKKVEVLEHTVLKDDKLRNSFTFIHWYFLLEYFRNLFNGFGFIVKFCVFDTHKHFVSY